MGRKRPRGKGRGRGRGRITAKEVELETDDEGNNPMSLQQKSPLLLQPQRGCRDCILFVLHIV